MQLNVGYKKDEKRYPVTIELSLEETQDLVKVLDTAAVYSPELVCHDVTANLVTTLRKICAHAKEDLPHET